MRWCDLHHIKHEIGGLLIIAPARNENDFMILDTTRIAILNRKDTRQDTSIHFIQLMKQIWASRGATVTDLFGVDRHVDADLLIVHVDASTVSSEYTEFARRFPRVVNLGATDITKDRYIDGLLSPADTYPGRVIVKTNLNNAGIPERAAARNAPISQRALNKVRRMCSGPRKSMSSKADYLIFDALSDVPDSYFSRQFVVQEFRPERVDNGYLLREYSFLNDRHVLRIEHSGRPIITSGTELETSYDPPHPALLALRSKLGLDYGKIDYAMINGRPFIYDAKKTLGMGGKATEHTLALARHLAGGVETLLNR